MPTSGRERVRTKHVAACSTPVRGRGFESRRLHQSSWSPISLRYNSMALVPSVGVFSFDTHVTRLVCVSIVLPIFSTQEDRFPQPMQECSLRRLSLTAPYGYPLIPASIPLRPLKPGSSFRRDRACENCVVEGSRWIVRLQGHLTMTSFPNEHSSPPRSLTK